jgi:hypothetical protein
VIPSLAPVTRLRPGPSTAFDRYGAPIPGADTSLVIPGCIIYQTATTETPQIGADQAISDLTILVPYDTDVVFTDRLTIGDDTDTVYQVVGSPTQYQNPFTGTQFGGVVFAKLVQG